MYHPFSVTETLNIAWHILKKNFATIAVYSLLAIIVIAGSGFIVKFILIDTILTYVGIMFSIIAISFTFLGFIKLVFQLIDKEYYDFDFSDIVPKLKMLFSYIILLVLVSTLAVFIENAINSLEEGEIPNVLRRFSGLIIEIFFLFYFPICACFIVDDGSGPFESVMQSFKLIKGNFLKYFLLFLIIELLVLIGAVTLIGMIVVVPFVNILLVVAYRKLVYSHIDAEDNFTETV